MPGLKRWPFVPSPGEVAALLDGALRSFNGDMLAAVRNVFIEQAIAVQRPSGEQVIADFLQRTGQYVTNDATRDAAIAEAVQNALVEAIRVSRDTYDLMIAALHSAPAGEHRDQCQQALNRMGDVLNTLRAKVVFEARTQAGQAVDEQAAQAQTEEPQWIVNDLAELGVKVGNRFFFLYKGDNLEYEDGTHDDGTPMLYRIVGKREFGEVCYPAAFYKEDATIPHRYTRELAFRPGLSLGKKEDGDWRPLPPSPGAAAAAPEGYPECSGDPASCPENEGYGCCKPSPVVEPAPTHSAMEAAARWVEARRDAYVGEHANYDPETGGMDLPGDGAEYVGELEEIAEGLRALAPLPEPRVDDLAHTVRRLAHALRKAAPDNDLPAKALDYLKRHGLQGSPLRGAVVEPGAQAGREADDAARPTNQPLSPTIVGALADAAGYSEPGGRADFINGLRWGERAHGIDDARATQGERNGS